MFGGTSLALALPGQFLSGSGSPRSVPLWLWLSQVSSCSRLAASALSRFRPLVSRGPGRPPLLVPELSPRVPLAALLHEVPPLQPPHSTACNERRRRGTGRSYRSLGATRRPPAHDSRPYGHAASCLPRPSSKGSSTQLVCFPQRAASRRRAGAAPSRPRAALRSAPRRPAV